MTKLEDVLTTNSIEKIMAISHGICEILIINIDEYQYFIVNDIEKKNTIDQQMFDFKKSADYLGFYNKVGNEKEPTNYKIFIKSTWNSKKICERKIIEVLKQ